MLALALGKSVRELWESMDGKEFAQWQRFYRRHPFGPARGDMQAGIVARAIYRASNVRPIPGLQEFVIVTKPTQEKKAAKPAEEPAVDPQSLQDQLGGLAAAIGCAFTPAPAGAAPLPPFVPQ